MAGKGRGVAAFTFNIEALGIGRGSMPEARVGPSPLFPVSDEHSLTRSHTQTKVQRRMTYHIAVYFIYLEDGGEIKE